MSKFLWTDWRAKSYPNDVIRCCEMIRQVLPIHGQYLIQLVMSQSDLHASTTII